MCKKVDKIKRPAKSGYTVVSITHKRHDVRDGPIAWSMARK
jgi:ABC-type uncharacterized transport system ATPase subunit